MIVINATVICLAYILGLLLTGFPGTIARVPLGAIVMLITGLTIAFFVRRVWRAAPKAWVWIAAGLTGAVAIAYFQFRLPQPGPTDICHWAPQAVLTERHPTCVSMLTPVQETPTSATPASATPIKKAPAKQSSVKQSSVKQSSVKQSSVKQSPAKQSSVKQSPANQSSANQSSAKPEKVEVEGNGESKLEGKVTTAPRLTRSGRLQFELAATRFKSSPDKAAQLVTGTVYVTLPPWAGTQLYPGLTVTVTGSLYQPKPATHPGGFDFSKYLAQQGIFSGLNATALEYPTAKRPTPPLFWVIRQRIVQAQEFGLGNPEGAFVSALVMGKTAVDLPYNIQDQFKQTGLAHALAASGAQVSLLVGVILTLTRRFSGSVRLGLGTGILVLYVGLTGVEPSVLRAGVMGFVALIALTADRKVKPIGALLLTATFLLLLNPIWIWNLGFQLSFLATLGLLVTVPVLTQWLDWMPSGLTPLFAVPIAAYLWTLPLMLNAFGVVSPYSILVNILVGPLITIASIGGMISAVAALIYPWAGSILAWTLYYPAHLLIKIAEISSQLPGNTVAVGTINAAQVGLLYGLIGLVWQWQRIHRYWWLAVFVGIGLVAVPVGYSAVNLSQVTVLSTEEQPVLAVQDKGRVGLIHSGNVKDTQFTVLPFLQQQGINQLNWAMAPSLNADEITAWQQILATKSIDLFYSSPEFNDDPASVDPASSYPASSYPAPVDPAPSYPALLQQVKSHHGIALPLFVGNKIQLGSITVEQIYTRPDILHMQTANQTWLWMEGVPSVKRQTDLVQRLSPVDVLGWSGKALIPQLLEKANPKQAIVFGNSIDPATQQWFSQHHIPVHSLVQDGAVRSSPQGLVSLSDREN